MPVHGVHLAATVVGALARVAAVGQEHIEVEEIAAVTVAAGVGKTVDALAEVVGVVRVGEVLPVAEPDAVVHPFHRNSLPAAEKGQCDGGAL